MSNIKTMTARTLTKQALNKVNIKQTLDKVAASCVLSKDYYGSTMTSYAFTHAV